MIECIKLPCCCGQTGKNRSSTLQGREICPSWRMAPGIITLTASVVAIAYCLIKRNTYLCIPFGCGALSSIYLIYLGHQYRDLKSLHQSSEEFKQSNIELKRQVRDLGSETVRLQGQNEQLEQTREQLDGQVVQMQEAATRREQQLERAESLNQTLQQRSTQLQVALDHMARQIQDGSGNLDQLRAVLLGFETERDELGSIRDRIIEALEPINPEEYRKACEGWARLRADIATAETTLPELQGLVESQKKIKAGYESLLERTTKIFDTLAKQGDSHLQELGSQADEFKEILAQFKRLGSSQQLV
ncbi:MAG: hypothetical protein S4CHLAM81_13360 [Chlamydiales bacterium]|nr:hypothetical protein [Chlamydiales bacterium]MCH9636108.1 hypothetical protein [Chlamydiales bacterium]MCH9703541.1 hypothetical protein [Chlamydiota bacterium]